MLDDLKEEQLIAYKTLTNAIEKNSLSHAYLFEINNYDNSEKFILSFAKALLCKNHYTNNSKCKECHQCENIDKNIYSDLQIINPDGLWIKKEQLMELQSNLKTKSLNNGKRVYIINQADRLNDSSANSILKFLEEPEPDIIAILVTNNIHQLLETIISRCQIITLKPSKIVNDKSVRINAFLSKKYEKEVLDEHINNTINFNVYLEKNKLQTILFTKNLFFDKFIDRESVITFLELSVLLYKDVLNSKLNKDLEYYEIKDIIDLQNNNIETLNKKIEVLLNCIENEKVNVNNNLMLDKLIIDLGSE